MNPLVRPKPGDAMAETIAHTPDDRRPGLRGPSPSDAEPSPMNDRPTPPSGRAAERYYFSSGDRPLEGYTIKRAIGRGGFGEVYYAVSDAGKEVALKLLTRNVEIEKRGVQQCMNLKSPHLITIFDMRTVDEGDTFVVMEYVSGPSLAQLLEEHPDGLPPHEVRMWLKGLVDGVAYLHDHGIVHRDLKPANLFLEEGTVKIGDYGLSKFIANSQEAGHSASVGTCHYMAPEISTGKYQRPIDIYAIGVILFEMLTGRVPFEGETPHEVLMKHLTSRPDLSPLPEPYREIVGRALAKDPTRRPQSAYELLVPQDAPRAPDVRFIGEGKSSPAGPSPAAPPVVPVTEPPPSPAPPQEEVFRIGEEESVLYIGPDTMPPGRRWGRQARQTRRAQRSAGRGARVRRVAEPAPTSPPPLPAPRVRVAEAATSMLIAVPTCLVFGLPAAALMGVEPHRGPELAALLVAAAVLGIWSLLVPIKFWEGRNVDAATRRFTLGAVGLAMGALMTTMVGWTHIDPPRSLVWYAEADPTGEFFAVLDLDAQRALMLGPPVFFALTLAFGPWCRLAARDRSSRVRVWPVVWTGILGVIAANLVPAPLPWSVAVLALMAIVLQLVSPRDERAARYARSRAA